MTKNSYHYMLHKYLPGLTEPERQAILLEANMRSVTVPAVVIEALRDHIAEKRGWLEEQIGERKELNRIIQLA